MAARQAVDRLPGLTSPGRLVLLALLLAGCAQGGRVPVADRSTVSGPVPDVYQVSAGDTLYSIAWRFSLEYRTLAQANGIRPPYTIYVGQRLQLTAPPSPPRSAATPPAAPGRPPAASAAAQWTAPTGARVARGYGQGNRGIDYQLETGDRVAAAAAGEVVYAGSGLGGFRHLVIVKHDPEYLSAYGFDGTLGVREGQRIKAGALLADKEDGGRRAGTLHFEIRRDGVPVDPRPLIGPAR